jgi:methionyl-tRNA formyltransferase
VVRALHPHIGARVLLADGTPLGVMRAALAEPTDPANVGPAPAGISQADAQSGRELGVRVREGRLLLCCAEGTLVLLEVKPPGARPMDAGSYVRGHRLPSG